MSLPPHSRLKISAALWGPGMWDHLIAYAFSYPDTPTPQQCDRTIAYFTNLCIPCEECQTNYNTIIESYPPVAKSRVSLIDWIYTVYSADRSRRNTEMISWELFVKNFQDKHNLSVAMYPTGCSTCPSRQ